MWIRIAAGVCLVVVGVAVALGGARVQRKFQAFVDGDVLYRTCEAGTDYH